MWDKKGASAVEKWHMNTTAKTKGMKIWQEGHEGIIRFEELGDKVFGTESLGVEIKVGENDTFRLAGGAAGVHDDGFIRGVDAGVRVTDKFTGFLQEFVPCNDVLRFFDMILAAFGEFINDADDKVHRAGGRNYNDLFEISIFNNGLDFRIRNIDAKNDFRLSLIDIVFDFFFATKWMDHVGNSADFVDSIEHINSLRGIWHTDGNAVALFGANSFEGGGDFVDFFD